MFIRTFAFGRGLALLFWLAGAICLAQPALQLSRLSTTPLHYNCPMVPANISIRVDGNITEEEWSGAPWTSDFVDIEGEELPGPRYRTRARLQWDSDALYIAAEIEEPNLWATLKNHDDIIFRDNDFEVFLSGNTADREYYEFEVNAFNTLFDLLLPMPYRDGGKADIPWNASGFRSAVRMSGTLNDAHDQDQGWTIEMRIPFSDLAKSGKGASPKPGSVWRINFSRVEYDVEVNNGRYEKLKNESGKDLPERNWVWSPQGIIDMHFPERWGYLTFLKQEGKGGESPFKENFFEKSLWMIYHAQRKHFREHGTYLKSVPEAIIAEISRLIPGGTRISLKASGKRWHATLSSEHKTYTIDFRGRLTNNLK